MAVKRKNNKKSSARSFIRVGSFGKGKKRPNKLTALVFAIVFGVIGGAYILATHALSGGLLATMETGDFSQFNMGTQTQNSGASISVDTSRAYEGTRSAKAAYYGGGGNNYARGLESINWSDGTDVWYGEAVYLPAGFKNAMQGEVDLMRWDNYSLSNTSQDWGGIVIYGSDKMARLMRFNAQGDHATLIGPFNLQEGQWNWVEVHQKLSQYNGQALSELYINGSKIGSSTVANKYSRDITRIRYGLVAVASGSQINPLTLWFDRAYYGSSQLGPYNSPDTASPTVSVTTPTSGSTVGGTVNLSATASDNVGIASVQFKVDGQNYGSQLTTAPYTVKLDTTKLTDGTHTITAVANDTAGNSTNSSSVGVTVSNTSSNGGGGSGGSSTVVEGESFSYSGFANLYNDSNDSGGKDLRFISNGSATKTVTLPEGTQLTLRVRVWACSSSPKMTVALDGNTIQSTSVPYTSYKDYVIPVNISAGSHKISVTMSNGYYSSNSCGNSLHLDKLTVN